MHKEKIEESGKYLTFTLADEKYGVTISSIREIIGMMKIVSVPGHEAHIKGVINLRDSVIPVIDLRTCFSLAEAPYTERTCIIIAEIQQNQNVHNIGLVVDMVSEVVVIKAVQIEDVLSLGKTNGSSLWGMAKINKAIVKLLDFNQLFTVDGQQALAQAA